MQKLQEKENFSMEQAKMKEVGVAVADLVASPPKTWKMLMSAWDGAAFERWDGLFVIVSEAQELDGRTWRHVSASRKTRPPTYDELGEIKRLFIGDQREAYQVFPPKARHVNIHSHCLHLWSCDEGPALPAFDRGMGTI